MYLHCVVAYVQNVHMRLQYLCLTLYCPMMYLFIYIVYIGSERPLLSPDLFRGSRLVKEFFFSVVTQMYLPRNGKKKKKKNMASQLSELWAPTAILPPSAP